MFGVRHKCVGGSRSSRSIGGQMLVLVLITYMCGVATSMRVKHFFVPDLADLTSRDPLKLECDLEINPDEKSQIVIEWHLNDTLLYLWNENRTSKLPYINSNFVAPVTANRTEYQNSTITAPLIITNKTINLTGQYKCLANINVINEVSNEDKMQMYVPIDNITLDQVYDNGTNQLNVTCGTENVYPRPEIKLFINGLENFNTTINPILDVRLNEKQLFDISATYTLSTNSLKSSSRINCSITLPGVGQSSSRLTQFNKSGGRLTCDRINFYLISASALVILTMTRGFI